MLIKENNRQITKQIINLLEIILKIISHFKTTYNNQKKEFLWDQPHQWRTEGGVQTPPPKFRLYRWSPPSHEQEEPVSRFPFVVHCVLIGCNLLNKDFF